MRYSLNKVETFEFTQFLLDPKTLNETSSIYPLLDRYDSWELELVFISYLWSQLIQKSLKKGITIENIVELIYSKREYHNFSIEEFSVEYIEFLVAHVSDPSLELEENLVLLNDKFLDYDWREQIRS